MPIICETVDGSTEKFSYGCTIDFVLAYPKSSPVTPLGDDWKFDPCLLPLKYKTYAEKLANMDIFPDDVFLITCPKSGSTWSQEMIWLLINNLDYEKAMKIDTFRRCVLIEFDSIYTRLTLNMLDVAEKMPTPRLLRSHLPAGLLPRHIWTVKPKIIYTARSIKDTAISLYHHYVSLHDYKGNLNDFLDAFLNNRIIFTPNHSHIRDFWFMREEENILFLTYEEMKTDLLSVLRKTAQFLGKTYSDVELKKLEKHLSFDEMKNNPSVNFERTTRELRKAHSNSIAGEPRKYNTEGRFMRKGIVGSHREEMPPEFIERFDKLTTEFNCVYGTQLEP